MPSEPSVKDILGVALRVAAGLERVQARYALVGSLASSLQGDPRSTNDIDFVSTLSAEQIPEFVAALGEEFDVDEAALADSIRTIGSWNIYFLPWMTKIDLFALDSANELRRTQLSRAVPTRIGDVALIILRPDDSVLSKLLWYRDGGGVSDQQWRDILGVLRVSRAQLDDQYLDVWASRLGLDSLLAKARREALSVHSL
jgi:hypothetical protein